MNGSTRSLLHCLPSFALVLLLASAGLPVTRSVAQATPKPPGAPVAPGAPGAPAARPAAKPEAPNPEAAKPDPAAELIELFKKEENITNTLGMVMVWVPSGYRVAQFEVTQEQFEKIHGENPSRFPGDRNPVERVTWTEADAFCASLTKKEIDSGKLPKGYAYSLPTQAQWEYFVADADLKDALTSRLGDQRSHLPVGTFGPNKLGLHDVRGNVWEWCSTPVARGGSFRTFEDWLQTSFRFEGNATTRYDDIGFRIVLTGSAAGAK